MSDISLEQAQQVVEAALKKARGIGTKMDIAVVDAGANLRAFVRMDDAWLGSIDIGHEESSHGPLLLLIWTPETSGAIAARRSSL